MFQCNFFCATQFRDLQAHRLAQLDDSVADFESGFATAPLHVDMHRRVVVAVEKEAKTFDNEQGGHGVFLSGPTITDEIPFFKSEQLKLDDALSKEKFVKKKTPGKLWGTGGANGTGGTGDKRRLQSIAIDSGRLQSNAVEKGRSG